MHPLFGGPVCSQLRRGLTLREGTSYECSSTACKDARWDLIVGSGPPWMSPRLGLPEMSKVQYCASSVGVYIAEVGTRPEGRSSTREFRGRRS